MKLTFGHIVRFGLVVFLFSRGIFGYAQDPHFSQYVSLPAIYNPAMTGMHDGIIKLALLYQDHLNFANTNIRKGVINLDYGKDIPVGDFTVDRIGVGGGVIYDDYSLGAFFNNSIFLNVAYLKSLTANNNHKLGLGLQFHYSNRTIDYSRLTFGTQFLRGYYDATIFSQETTSSRSTDYFDMQAGLTYHFISPYFTIKTGLAAYHLTQPESNSINNFKIPISLSSFVSYEMWFENGKRLYVDLYYRNKNMLLSYFGGMAKYTIVHFRDYNSRMEKNYLVAGLNLNSNLLLSPYLGWRSPSIEAGFTFDIKISDVNYFAYPFESFVEFMLAYKLNLNRPAVIHVGGDLF